MSESSQSSDARRFSDVLEQLAGGAEPRLTLRELVAADGEISSDERENLSLLEQLLPR